MAGNCCETATAAAFDYNLRACSTTADSPLVRKCQISETGVTAHSVTHCSRPLFQYQYWYQFSVRVWVTVRNAVSKFYFSFTFKWLQPLQECLGGERSTPQLTGV